MADSESAPTAPPAGPEINEAVAGLSLSSRAVHADDHIAYHRAVAPAMHVSTTFRYSDDPDMLESWNNVNVSWVPPVLSKTIESHHCRKEEEEEEAKIHKYIS